VEGGHEKNREEEKMPLTRQKEKKLEVLKKSVETCKVKKLKERLSEQPFRRRI